MADIPVTWSADDKQVIAAYKRQIKQSAKLLAQNKKLTAEAKKSAQALSAHMAGVDRGAAKARGQVGNLGRAAMSAKTQIMAMFGTAGAVAIVAKGIQTAVAELKQDLQEFSDRNERARGAQVDVGRAVSDLVLNFAGDASLKPENLKSEILRISKSTKAGAGIVAQTLSDAQTEI